MSLEIREIDPSQRGATLRNKMGRLMTDIPNTADALLTREKVAAALTAAGFPTRAKTLATKATRGGGPPYRLYSARALYRWGGALDWARSRLTQVIHSTSELSNKDRVA